MENGPFEDVFPVKSGDIPLLCYVSLPAGMWYGPDKTAHLHKRRSIMSFQFISSILFIGCERTRDSNGFKIIIIYLDPFQYV